jgi:hypothetical protein
MGPDDLDRRNREALIDALTALVLALDQRVPHIERAGERRIAIEAATLRGEAVARIAALRADVTARNAH